MIYIEPETVKLFGEILFIGIVSGFISFFGWILSKNNVKKISKIVFIGSVILVIVSFAAMMIGVWSLYSL